MEMKMDHQTTTPKQVQTDTMAVFADQSGQFDPHENLVLVRRVDVPQYTAPCAEAPELDRGDRLRLAVNFAITSPDTHLSFGEAREMEFWVMDDVEDPMAEVDGCPSAMDGEIPAGVWNPNEESASEWDDA